ncbi:MAG: FliM/FliN family flagellar motor switch protein [Polyangiales bacterium]
MSDDPATPVLSAEESEVLLNAMREAEQEQSRVEEAQLGSQDGFMHEALTQVAFAIETIEPGLRRALLPHTGCAVRLHGQEQEIATMRTVVGLLSDSDLGATLRGAHDECALLVVSSSLLKVLVERLLGAPLEFVGQAPEEVDPSVTIVFPTPIARRVLRSIFRELLEVVSMAILGDTSAVGTQPVLWDKAHMPDSDEHEPLAWWRLQIGFGDIAEGVVHLLLNAQALRAMLPSKHMNAALVSPMQARAHMQVNVEETALPLVAVLGRRTITVRELLALEMGMTLVLDEAQSEPVQVLTDTHLCFVGEPVKAQGRVAVRVTELNL